MDLNIDISGIDEVIDSLERAPRTIVKAAFAKSLAAAAVPVVRALEPNIPTDTGDLKDHLMTDIEIAANGEGGRAQIGFGKEGWKARLVETGHREVTHKPAKKEIGAVAPHPFMAPAAVIAADESTQRFTETLSESLEGDVLQRAS